MADYSLDGMQLGKENSWSVDDLSGMINDQIYQRNNGDWDGNDYGFSFFNAGTGMSGVDDSIAGDPRAQSILNKIVRGDNNQYSYQGNLNEDISSAFGPKGIQSNWYINPNNLDTRTIFKDSTGKDIYSTTGNEKQSWGDKWMPLIVGTGLGAIVGPAVGAAYGGAAGGAAAGATSGYVQSGGDWDAAGKGALIGGVGAGVASGINSGLEDYTSSMGNNPSAYRPGLFTPQQSAALSRAAGSVTGTALRGGNIPQSLVGNAIPIASNEFGLGQMFDRGVGNVFERFTGGNVDDFGVPGGMSMSPQYGGGLSELFDKDKLGGPFSTTQALQDSYNPVTSNFDFGSALDGGLSEGRRATTQGAGADYSLGADLGFGSGDGFSTGGGPSFGTPQAADTGFDWQRKLREFGASTGGQNVMKLLGQLDPRFRGLDAVLGGNKGMSGLEAGLGALFTAYNNRKNNQAIKQQQGNLQSLFSPNSAYAQQLRQQLSRKDAAGGRRSQYGPREVELQARLAELNSRNAPQLQQLSNARNSNNNQLLRDLMIYGSKSGAFSSLADMFGGGQQSSPYQLV